MQISSVKLNGQFDKVCKKKFLIYLDEEHSTREVTREERAAARNNMQMFVMRLEAEEMRGKKTQQKIITDTMISVFMTFLTYGKNKRRNFLQNDITIEESFDAEVLFQPHFRIMETKEAEDEANAVYSINDDSHVDLLLDEVALSKKRKQTVVDNASL